MDFVDAYILASPGLILVALVTAIFFFRHAWPHISSKKQTYKPTYPALTKEGSNPSVAVSKEPEIPNGWWTGHEVFDLERRALFGQTWIYLAHSSQFSKAGAYQSFDVAGFPIFLIRGKDDQIRAFHNVCRHRAYTITRKETGTSTVLGCRYHGWSYDTRGQLVKAPQFDDVPGFDKAQNGLFEIHAHMTDQGWVFVNLVAGEPTPFEGSVELALDGFARVAGVDLHSGWVAGQTLPGEFNWKMWWWLIYYCVKVGAHRCEHLTTQLEHRVSEALVPSLTTRIARIFTQASSRAECSLFPRTLLYSFDNAGLWMSLTFFPASERRTHVRYDLFTRTPGANSNKETLSHLVEEVSKELIRNLELEFQAIMQNPGLQATSELDWSTQSTSHQILTRLQQHAKLEKTQGAQVRPAMRQPKGSSLFQQAEQLCKELDCASGSNGNGTSSTGLEW